MLKKVVTKNVGVLRAFDTPGSPQLAKLTMIYARNGRGKTTLSAVLRASSSADAAIIRGRQTLGNGGAAPEVTLVFCDGSNSRFSGGRWTAEAPIEVFDSTFISENLFAGEKVDLGHDRSLFTVILGRAGVKLARQQEFFNGAAKRRAAALKEAEGALASDIPSDMSREEFLGHVPSSSIDEQIEDAEKALKGAQQGTRLAGLKLLSKFAAPTLPVDVKSVLNATVSDIQTSARDRLAEHFVKHKLGKQGEAWLRFGQEHIVDDECPFCGRDNVDELGLVTVYQRIFGEAYQAHLATVKEAAEQIELALGPAGREQIARTISTNAEAAREWGEFCNLSAVQVPDVEGALAAIEAAHLHLKPLLEAKRNAPLEIVANDEELQSATEKLATASTAISAYAAAVDEINGLAEKRRTGPQPSESDCRARIDRLLKRKRRTEPGVQDRITAMLRAKRADARAKKMRTEVQDRLKSANEAAANHYYDRVNHYLDMFGAAFRISKISNSMSGNLGSVDYGLIVRGHAVSRGRGVDADDEPTFKNTLSSGDKATLAFAFFLAGLDRDASLAGKIVVFDDPLSSHDTHRQGKTVDLLSHLCGRCEQVIVLSHDAHFLRRVSGRCPTVDQVAYEIAFDGSDQWSKAKIADLDHLCRDSHAVLVDQLLAYYEQGNGDPISIAPGVRKVLETHYRRTFSCHFGRNDYLGTIISKIRDGGVSHPCAADLATLEGCNAATNGEHHGADPEVAPPDPPDPDELRVVVRDSLRLIGVLPSSLAGASPPAVQLIATTSP